MTPPRTLVQLTAPGSGGVHDYLACLRGCWDARGIGNRVMVLSQAAAQQEPLAARLQKIIDATGRPCTLLLHFSGYGFHPRGVCSWLAREVEATRQQLGGQVLIVTVFHELYAAGGPLWKSAFWLSRWQASIAARLARVSDRLWTNTDAHAQWLRSIVGAAHPLAVWPVFSTIGEPVLAPAALHTRSLRMVAFGLQRTRHRALALLPPHAARLQRSGITEVVEVGAGHAFAWAVDGIAHRHAGRLGTPELQRLLEDSTFGLIDYPLRDLGKSTVFAAYASHGMLVVNTTPAASGDADSPLAEQLVRLSNTTAPQLPASDMRDAAAMASPQAMANACRSWYGQHTLSLQATELAQFCDAVTVGHTARAA